MPAALISSRPIAARQEFTLYESSYVVTCMPKRMDLLMRLLYTLPEIEPTKRTRRMFDVFYVPQYDLVIQYRAPMRALTCALLNTV